MTKIIPMGTGHAIMLCGGEMHKIQVDGKVYEFEMHPYCGPTILDKNGSPKAKQPPRFLYAASLWAAQGEKMEDGLCVWYHEPEVIKKHIGGRHWLYVGEKPAVRGT